MKKQLEAIAESHGFRAEDAEEMLYTVQDMLDALRKKLEKEEPSATDTIRHLMYASSEIVLLSNVFWE